MDLIRNCVHHSDHSTYIERSIGGIPSAVRKATFTEAGTKDLTQEIAGLRWYCSQRGIVEETAILESDIRAKYAKVRLAFHAGDTVKVPVNPDQILSKLDAALTHHFEVFGPSEFKMTHGDYSICNHIFDGDHVDWVIDWEHFNDVLPPEYDAIYTVLEPYLFWIANEHQPSAASIQEANRLLARIDDAISPSDGMPTEPAIWLRSQVENHKDVWGAQWAKVPFIAFDAKHVHALDKALHNG